MLKKNPGNAPDEAALLCISFASAVAPLSSVTPTIWNQTLWVTCGVTAGERVEKVCQMCATVHGGAFSPMAACPEQRLNLAGDPKWTVFVQHLPSYLSSCLAVTGDSKVRYYSYDWHEVSILAYVAQQLLIGHLDCILSHWAVWACTVSLNCCLSFLHVSLKSNCRPCPVTQYSVHALTLRVCSNEGTLGFSFICWVY